MRAETPLAANFVATGIRASQHDRRSGQDLIRMLKTAGLFASLIAAASLVMAADLALARKSRPQRQPAIGWYRLSGDVEVRCVERSYSVSVGNPAFHRVAIWPGPCRP